MQHSKLSILIGVFLISLVLLVFSLNRNLTWDITQNDANSITPASKNLIANLAEDLTLQVYSPDINMLNLAHDFLAMYTKNSANIKVELKQAVLDPKQAQELKVYTQSNLIASYKNITHAIDISYTSLQEATISSLIHKTITGANSWVIFLTGHNEFDPNDSSELGLTKFSALLKNSGLHVTTLNLAQERHIPRNTDLLVVANPQQVFLPLEQNLLQQYLANGGNMLWLTEPESPVSSFLTEEFGIRLAKGVVIDPHSKHLGSPHPALKIVTHYPAHGIFDQMRGALILPWSGHLEVAFPRHEWRAEAALQSAFDAWTYDGPSSDEIEVLQQHKLQSGPLNLLVSLERSHNTARQRAVVVADSSFMLNKFIQHHSNAQFAVNLVTYTHSQANSFVFSPTPPRDFSYNPSKFDRFIQQYFFTLLLPFLFLSIGFILQRR